MIWNTSLAGKTGKEGTRNHETSQITVLYAMDTFDRIANINDSRSSHFVVLDPQKIKKIRGEDENQHLRLFFIPMSTIDY